MEPVQLAAILAAVVVVASMVSVELAERWFLPDPAEEREVDRRIPIPAEEYV